MVAVLGMSIAPSGLIHRLNLNQSSYSSAVAHRTPNTFNKSKISTPQKKRQSCIVAGAPSSAPSPTEGWWTKDIPENMHHISSVQELVDALQSGAVADQLVVVDFYAPWCGACKALFPKLKQLCRDHPDVRFITCNFDQNKALARGLGVKVLPFFHFYRGAEGRVDAFAASVSKIAKLRDAIENHKSERCFLESQPPNPLAEFPDVYAKIRDVPGSIEGGYDSPNSNEVTKV